MFTVQPETGTTTLMDLVRLADRLQVANPNPGGQRHVFLPEQFIKRHFF
jgi:hypothetical protein